MMRKAELEMAWVNNRPSKDESCHSLANKILRELMQFRRAIDSDDHCAKSSCQACFAPHLSKVVDAIKHQVPICFVLPAFPGKSPNPEKVLGHLPDMGEQRALVFLNSLCDRIKEYYSPGARVILCSDGRVFSDLVGMDEEHISDYQGALAAMIEMHELANISTFNLDELYEEIAFDTMREQLMHCYGTPLEVLREKVSQGKNIDSQAEHREAHRMYCGITKFLFEDAMHATQTKSRTAIQKDCRKRAYEVIRRSNAWSELIADQFPEAVRLSIHPQACGSKKFGIMLLGHEQWMTPWHGVALKSDGEFRLVKRSQAEAMGATMVFSAQGHPSHYKIEQELEYAS